MIELEPCYIKESLHFASYQNQLCRPLGNPCPDDTMLKTETTFTLSAHNFKSEFRSGAIQSFLQNPVQVKALKETKFNAC